MASRALTNALSSAIRREQRVWARPDSLRFYQSNRNEPEHLYLSERLFLPEILPRVSSCLDVGCAAGGFSRIMKSFNPRLSYTGVDVNQELIAAARRHYPDSRFEVGDGVHFSTPTNSFDLVFCTGILHVNSYYREIVRGAYGQARRFLLCDFRLTWERTVIGKLRVDFEGTGHSTELPYIILNLDELLEDLKTLIQTPIAITVRGYPHAVSEVARGVPSEVIMAFALIEKGSTTTTPRIEVDIRQEAAWGASPEIA